MYVGPEEVGGIVFRATYPVNRYLVLHLLGVVTNEYYQLPLSEVVDFLSGFCSLLLQWPNAPSLQIHVSCLQHITVKENEQL